LLKELPVESKSSLPSIGLEIYKNLTLGDLEVTTSGGEFCVRLPLVPGQV